MRRTGARRRRRSPATSRALLSWRLRARPPGEDRVVADRGHEQTTVLVAYLAAQNRVGAVAPVEDRAAHDLALGRGLDVVDRDADRRDPLLSRRVRPDRRAHAVVDERVRRDAREQPARIDELRADR